ncbi:hypothetical protein [Derxia gummosa]|uniref:Uncharacterized protein n=1 Tax=Derxia gummosa DSM 723 TaxID=1121388 RepID=A0A8B6X2X4_9BURK|nr:hypothetical protein [Derxia gummosa]
MNPLPIETARDNDLRLSMTAMQRAAQRARELAARTGTCLVVVRDGVLTEIDPSAPAQAAAPSSTATPA